MTSMPASRRARAIIFAPRSWPSSPGLATSTRMGTFMSDIRTFFVCSKNLSQRAADLAKSGPAPDGVEQRRHQIAIACCAQTCCAPTLGAAIRHTAQHIERALNIPIMTCFAKPAQLFDLPVFRRLIDAEGFNGLAFIRNPVAVHAHDDGFGLLDFLLILVTGARDFRLRKPQLDVGYHAAHAVDGADIVASARFQIEGKAFQKVTAAKRIGHGRYAGLAGDDLLRA